jgi:hypothetical protein
MFKLFFLKILVVKVTGYRLQVVKKLPLPEKIKNEKMKKKFPSRRYPKTNL